jgi:hypothetical protein
VPTFLDEVGNKNEKRMKELCILLTYLIICCLLTVNNGYIQNFQRISLKGGKLLKNLVSERNFIRKDGTDNFQEQGFRRKTSLQAVENIEPIAPYLKDVKEMTIEEVKEELGLRRVDVSDCIAPDHFIQKLNKIREVQLGDAFLAFSQKYPQIVQAHRQNPLPPLFGKHMHISEETREQLAKLPQENFKIPKGVHPKVLLQFMLGTEAFELMRDPTLQKLFLETIPLGKEAFYERVKSDPGELTKLCNVNRR